MADISKCKGDNCPMKENCYRYKAIEGICQTYFIDIPLEKDNTCEYYWPIIKESIEGEEDV